MENPVSLKRPAFPNRPWIRGKAYDDFSRATVLHCDAYVFKARNVPYLRIDWREGGHKRVALDTYLIESDGLTPVWDGDTLWHEGVPAHWSKKNNDTMARLHLFVIQAVAETSGRFDRWPRIVTQCHYVKTRDSDCEAVLGNKYVERMRAMSEPKAMSALEPKSVGKPRGRARGARVLETSDTVRLVWLPGTPLPDVL